MFEINVPPLRERREDILPLANQLVESLTQRRARLSPAVTAILERYAWPGNVRELRNAMERATLLCRGDLILPEHLPIRIRPAWGASQPLPTSDAGSLDEIEVRAVLQTLRQQSFNRTATAKALGISRRALIYKLQRLRELGQNVDGP